MTISTSSLKPILQFLPNPAEEDEGLGHAGIETYRNDPIAAIARETGQNSRDAFATLPVKLSFDVFEIPREQVPAIDEFQKAIHTCREQSKGQEKESAFFQQAANAIASPFIHVLRIADFNTTGAHGPSTKGTPFHSLLKASGVSVKSNIDSGGSFGIGKNAVFAASDLQTAFYSTNFEDAGEMHGLAQGKIVLISHTDSMGEARRQTGYWGKPGFQPVSDFDDLPQWLKRSGRGTSIFVLGFRDTPNWQQRIASSLVQNFFPAIHAEEMQFSIDDGQIEISKASLASMFVDSKICEVVAHNSQAAAFELSKNLYECLVSPESKVVTTTLPELGNVRIRVHVADGLPKKVVITRNGMVITDSLEHFGDKFVRFPMYRDFVAIATPIEKSGSAFIKKLEDPEHRALSAERLPDATKRANAKAAMKRFAKEIRDVIKQHTLTKFEGEISADEMRKYFSSDTESGTTQKGSQTDDPETLRYKIEEKKEKRPPHASTDGNGTKGKGVGGEYPGPGPGPDQHPGQPGPNLKPNSNTVGGAGPIRKLVLEDFRNSSILSAGNKMRMLFFTPTADGEVEIVLQATGLNTNEDLVVSSSKDFAVEKGRLKGKLIAGARTSIEVELEEDYTGPIEIRAFVTATVPGSKPNEA